MAGRIASEDISELRERSDLAEIVAAHTQLRKTGRIFKGLCCFHQEKTPSLTVDPEKQLYYCHGCGVGGDVFSFLQRADGLSFSESAQRLADALGMQLRSEGPADAPEGGRSPLLAANEAAAAFFAELLRTAPEARGARNYLEGRGFGSEDAAKWRLGFSPAGSEVLFRRLLEAKFKSREIVDAGLAYVTEAGEHRDRFRGRLMFPVSDLSGKVVGFGARALGEEQPKYLNTSETAVYRKSKILFGLDRAKAEMVRSGFAIVTEGYTDVIALGKIGFSNVVATCGTALGEDHFALIKRFCERVILAFDADAAGQVASERGFGIHRKMGLEVLVAPVPQGNDPADVALKDDGAEIFKSIVEQSKPLMKFILEREIGRQRLDTAEGKAKAVEAAVDKMRWEPSAVARSEYGMWVAGVIGVDTQEVQLAIVRSAQGPRRSSGTEVIRMPGHVKVERQALAILLESPSQRSQASRFSTDYFTQPAHRVLFEALLEADAGSETPADKSSAARVNITAAIMDRLPDDETRRLAAELCLSPVISTDAEEVFLRLEEFQIERRIAAAQAKLKRLNSQTDSEDYDLLFEELMRLETERRRFEKD